MSTAPVKRGALSAVVSLDGTLTYRARSDGAPHSVINPAQGIYTGLPAVGDRVGCRDALYRVDDEPVLLLCGAVPAYRDLEIGDAGRDVRQLNRNLLELDEDEFTVQTQAALKALQAERGLDPTGVLARDQAVFLPGAMRIARVTGELGAAARPGTQVAQATTDTLEVLVRLPASQQGAIRRGDRARITLPGHSQVRGRVDRLGRVAVAGAGQGADAGEATLPAFVALDDTAEARALDGAPVQVDVTTKGVEDVLNVPVTALVGRSGGGYAVEVVRDSGRRELVAVDLGLFDTTRGRVQVEGKLVAGDAVVVPSP